MTPNGYRGMTDTSWPHGSRSAVAVTFNLDAELFWRLSPGGSSRPKALSLGNYGVLRGVPRLLDVLESFEVQATWFVSEPIARRHIDTITAIAQARHEIAARDDGSAAFGTAEPESQRTTLDGAARAVADITGRRPTGFRVAPGKLAEHTAASLRKAGFTWTSLGFEDDLPYFLEHQGVNTGIVDIPQHWELTDYPYFLYNTGPVVNPPGHTRIASYEAVLADWLDAFDAYHACGHCYVLTLDPESIGTPGRLLMLEELLNHITMTDEVWFATGAQIAEYWRAHHSANPAGHPERVRNAWI